MSRPNVPRWHAVLTISKAQALCDAGELEAGVELAIRGITLAHSCQSPRQMNRVRKLMRKLDESPWPTRQPSSRCVRSCGTSTSAIATRSNGTRYTACKGRSKVYPKVEGLPVWLATPAGENASVHRVNVTRSH